MCKHSAKKLPSIKICSWSDQYKTPQMCDKGILENGGRLKSVLDCYEIKKCVIKQLIITLMH